MAMAVDLVEPLARTFYAVFRKADRVVIDDEQLNPTREVKLRNGDRSDYIGLCLTPGDAVLRAEYFARNPRAKKCKGVLGKPIDVSEIDPNDAAQAHITDETHELLMVHFTLAGLAYYSHWRLTAYGEAVLAKKSKNVADASWKRENTAEASWDTWEFRDDLPLGPVAQDGTTLLTTRWMPKGWKPVPPVSPPPVSEGILLDEAGRERIFQLCRELTATCRGTPQS